MDPLAAASPSTWFAILERALREGDRVEAARARRRLRTLGVHVEFSDRWARRHPVSRLAREAADAAACSACGRALAAREVAGFDVPDVLDAPGAPRTRAAYCQGCADRLDRERGPGRPS